MSTTARRLRPTRREISWVRPPILPLTDSRSMRSLVERGSIAYSAVTQPLPLPVIQRGTPLVKDAVHSTRVSPNEISAEPSACSLQPRSMVTGRSWSGVRPSARSFTVVVSVMRCPFLGLAFGVQFRQVDGAGLHERHGRDLGPEEPAGQARELGLGVVAGGLEGVVRRRGDGALRGSVSRACGTRRRRSRSALETSVTSRPITYWMARRHQRVVRAAEHERVDAAVLQRLQVLLGDREQLRSRGDPGLDELHEPRARLREQLQIGCAAKASS